MAFQVGYSASEAQLLLTLSSLAYEDPNPLPGESITAQQIRMKRDIDAALAPPHYAGWKVAWGPALNDDRSNMLYVAGNARGDQYAVVIRGTDWSYIEDWLQDAGAVLGLDDFPYLIGAAGAGRPQIAEGTLMGMQTLIALRADAADPATSLESILQDKIAAGADIFVTGHSLGGCLASVVAPWLASLVGSANQLKVYTFAAPSAGNGDFARYYNGLFVDASGASTAFRVCNSLDIVPHAWASLQSIADSYQPAPLCPLPVKMLIAGASLIVGNQYVQVGSDAQHSVVQLPGVLVSVPGAAAPWLTDQAAFLAEVDYQHAPTTYLRLL